MKIFYAIQATGNGHIARAKELIPFLQSYGEVDTFLSGANSHLNPGFDVAYRSQGVSFLYNAHGGIDYIKTIKQLQFKRAWKEAQELPIQKYDLVINDFECITSLASRLQKVETVAVGHQYSFLSKKVPKPLIHNPMGEFVLRHYAPSMKRIGLHFQSYDNCIYPPVIKNQIKYAKVQNLGHISVYLSQFSALVMKEIFEKCSEYQFEIFTPYVTQIVKEKNITFYPIDNKLFTKSMINSLGVITGAGFETPAEALYLQKPIICIPIKGQYEQFCNAAAAKLLGAKICQKLSFLKNNYLDEWLQNSRNLGNINPIDNHFLCQQIMELAQSKTTSPKLDLLLQFVANSQKPKLTMEKN